MSTDLSLLKLVVEATLLVKLVLLILLAASLVSWAMIFRKWTTLKDARLAAYNFEARFWSGTDLTALYEQISSRSGHSVGMESMFESGFKEFMRLREQGSAKQKAVLESARRVMRVVLRRESDALERNLPFLATVGSISPFIGLFGTVWGIMHSFRSLGNVNQATLAMVAPGIAEALVATAMGLFAAIPAVIAYNRYTTDVERLISRYDNFIEEFSTILQHESHA